MVDVASARSVVDAVVIVVAVALTVLNCVVFHSCCCCCAPVVVSISVATGDIVVGSVVHTFVVSDSVVVMCGNIVEVLRLSSSNVVAVVKFRLLRRVGFEHFIVILRHLSRVTKP